MGNWAEAEKIGTAPKLLVFADEFCTPYHGVALLFPICALITCGAARFLTAFRSDREVDMLQIIRRKDLPDRIGLKRTAIDELIRTDATFPRPIKIGPRKRAVGFFSDEIDRWLESKRPAQQRIPSAQ
jgi:prophage regulatory protein